eukprot:767738-Hanusia_phi.AAC.4
MDGWERASAGGAGGAGGGGGGGGGVGGSGGSESECGDVECSSLYFRPGGLVYRLFRLKVLV